MWCEAPSRSISAKDPEKNPRLLHVMTSNIMAPSHNGAYSRPLSYPSGSSHPQDDAEPLQEGRIHCDPRPPRRALARLGIEVRREAILLLCRAAQLRPYHLHASRAAGNEHQLQSMN